MNLERDNEWKGQDETAKKQEPTDSVFSSIIEFRKSEGIETAGWEQLSGRKASLRK